MMASVEKENDIGRLAEMRIVVNLSRAELCHTLLGRVGGKTGFYEGFLSPTCPAKLFLSVAFSKLSWVFLHGVRFFRCRCRLSCLDPFRSSDDHRMGRGTRYLTGRLFGCSSGLKSVIVPSNNTQELSTGFLSLLVDPEHSSDSTLSTEYLSVPVVLHIHRYVSSTIHVRYGGLWVGTVLWLDLMPYFIPGQQDEPRLK